MPEIEKYYSSAYTGEEVDTAVSMSPEYILQNNVQSPIEGKLYLQRTAAPGGEIGYVLKTWVSQLADGGGRWVELAKGSAEGMSGFSFNSLSDKPQINSKELIGNKTATELGLLSLPPEAVQGDVIMYDNGKWVSKPITDIYDGSVENKNL